MTPGEVLGIMGQFPRIYERSISKNFSVAPASKKNHHAVEWCSREILSPIVFWVSENTFLLSRKVC